MTLVRKVTENILVGYWNCVVMLVQMNEYELSGCQGIAFSYIISSSNSIILTKLQVHLTSCQLCRLLTEAFDF